MRDIDTILSNSYYHRLNCKLTEKAKINFNKGPEEICSALASFLKEYDKDNFLGKITVSMDWNMYGSKIDIVGRNFNIYINLKDREILIKFNNSDKEYSKDYDFELKSEIGIDFVEESRTMDPDDRDTVLDYYCIFDIQDDLEKIEPKTSPFGEKMMDLIANLFDEDECNSSFCYSLDYLITCEMEESNSINADEYAAESRWYDDDR